jgi:hypothetical protein
MTRSADFPRASRWPGAVLALAAILLSCAAIGTPARAAESPVVMTNYTDPAQAMRWGHRSHWIQPWRSYLETVPATTFLDAVGINFNVTGVQASSTARMLGANGFRTARIEVGWGTVDYNDPTKMESVDRGNFVSVLTSLKANGIRPLILLNATQSEPCPVKLTSVKLTAAASAGATTISVDPADIGKIVLGRTGITAKGIAAESLITSVEPSGLAHLSRPLSVSLPAGALQTATLRYEPFRPATLADGSPNPRFEPTMKAWLDYVGLVTREAEAVLGSEEFDVEVWNELSWGSRFLNINGYYEPDIEWTHIGNTREILERTIAYIRDPGNGVPTIGIGSGFSNQTPWHSGTSSPIGLTALDKHPYTGRFLFPQQAQVNGNRPLNGLHQESGWKDSDARWHEAFTPSYESFFPEYFLSGIQTETLIRDMSPITSNIGGVPHGRFTHPEGGEPPELWITETNLAPGRGGIPRDQLSAADIRHAQSKIVLRDLAAFINKGVTALHFYAANGGDYSLVEPSFFSAIKSSPSAYPGDSAGGETIDSVGRLTRLFAGAEPITSPRSLSLRELTDYSSNVQFQGNGTPEFPPLYNRDVLAFLPFQIDESRFAIPTYVMTRNVMKIYPGRASTDPARFDLPPEPYGLTIGGVDGSKASVSATDPLTGESVPVQVLSRGEDQIEVKMPVTDSPRVLLIDDGSGGGEEPPVEEPPTEEPPVEEPPVEEPPVEEPPVEEPPVEEPPVEEPPVEEPPVEEPPAEEPPAEEPPAEEPPAEEPPVKRKGPPVPKTEEPPVEEPKGNPEKGGPKPRLRVEGTSTLLRTRRLNVAPRCQSRCTLSVAGRVAIGRRVFPLRPRGGGAAVGRDPVAVELGLSSAAARSARVALGNGLPVEVRLTGKVITPGGGAHRVRQVIVLTD